ncbi:unnamed protein product [Linum trigynum]|uniref:Uncharacterized protein n=1 Tax=Linum trigynum TaxID=586398 RepID=A0AAV2F7N3_9ROSI
MFGILFVMIHNDKNGMANSDTIYHLCGSGFCRSLGLQCLLVLLNGLEELGEVALPESLIELRIKLYREIGN